MYLITVPLSYFLTPFITSQVILTRTLATNIVKKKRKLRDNTLICKACVPANEGWFLFLKEKKRLQWETKRINGSYLVTKRGGLIRSGVESCWLVKFGNRYCTRHVFIRQVRWDWKWGSYFDWDCQKFCVTSFFSWPRNFSITRRLDATCIS